MDRSNPATAHFDSKQPGWFTRRVFNPFIGFLTRLGLPIAGWRACSRSVGGHRGSRAAPPSTRSTSTDSATWWPPVGTRSGSATSAPAARACCCHAASDSFTAVEVPDAEKPDILRAYLKRWKFEVGVFFDGVGPDSPEPELLRRGAQAPRLQAL